MARKDFYSGDSYEDDDIVGSKFNEAKLQMFRIHRAQDNINSCWTNPLFFNPLEGLYNYEIIFNNIRVLFIEVSSKCDEKERTKVREKQKEIRDLMKQFPVHRWKINETQKSREIKLNDKNWEKLDSSLLDHNLYIRSLMEKYKITTPQEEVYDGL